MGSETQKRRHETSITPILARKTPIDSRLESTSRVREQKSLPAHRALVKKVIRDQESGSRGSARRVTAIAGRSSLKIMHLVFSTVECRAAGMRKEERNYVESAGKRSRRVPSAENNSAAFYLATGRHMEWGKVLALLCAMGRGKALRRRTAETIKKLSRRPPSSCAFRVIACVAPTLPPSARLPATHSVRACVGSGCAPRRRNKHGQDCATRFFTARRALLDSAEPLRPSSRVSNHLGRFPRLPRFTRSRPRHFTTTSLRSLRGGVRKRGRKGRVGDGTGRQVH